MERDDSEALRQRVDQLEQTVEKLVNSIDRLSDELYGKDRSASFQPAAKKEIQPAPDVHQLKKPVPPATDLPSGKPGGFSPAPLPAFRHDKTGSLPKPDRIAHQPFKLPEQMRHGEYWLNRVGIGLLLFGVIFLFKYSIDQGWFTPTLRIVFGLALGALLCWTGFRTYTKRRAFSTILLGGAIGTWYITGFAAFQIFELISHLQAISFMLTITAISFLISVRQNNAILSVIGTLGGFSTPFLLHTESGNLPGLIVYTCLIMAAAVGIYFFKGWRSLLWLTTICSWMIFLIGLNYSIPEINTPALIERGSLQAGVVFAWLCFWAVPLLREILWHKNPAEWNRATLGFADNKLSSKASDILDRHLHLLAVTSPFIALGISIQLWPDVSKELWGWISFGLAAIYAATSHYLRTMPAFNSLRKTHSLMALSLFTLGLALLLDGNILLFSLATEAVILHMIARRHTDRPLSIASNLLHLATVLWLMVRLVELTDYHPGFFSGYVLTNLWVILTYVITAFIQKQIDLKRTYALVAMVTLAVLFINVLDGNIELIMLGLEAMIVFTIARLNDDEAMLIGSHAVFLLTGGIVASRMIFAHPDGFPILNLQAITDLWTIGLTVLVTLFTKNQIAKRVYLLAVILAVAGLIVREFGADSQFVLLAIQAFFVAILGRAMNDKAVTVYSHIFFGILTLVLYNRLIYAWQFSDHLPLLNLYALANLWVIFMLAVSTSALKEIQERTVYLVGSHVLVLGWLASELKHLPNGHGWISVAWGIYGAALLVMGLKFNIARLRQLAMGTLMLLVGKLFLVDLARLETIWRILLFMGFGSVFLLLGYYFPTLWKKETSHISPSDTEIT